ncbi:hypothetical protein A9Q96_01470 [Rhodobacterales bacterium 52_120_T64]|nr:hypothetical protein A9Q96_01470 [Rhodobacterales bacterium 52_120_T64]
MSDYSSFMDRTPNCSEQIAEASVSGTSRFMNLIATLKGKLNDHVQRRADNKNFKYLMQLDDYMLKDIGVSRGDVIWAGTLPVNANASLELAKLALANRSTMAL